MLRTFPPRNTIHDSLIDDVQAMLDADVRYRPLIDRNMAEVAEKFLGDATPLPVKQLGPDLSRKC
jgi:hypothetical protein